jgi:hypothetical protein
MRERMLCDIEGGGHKREICVYINDENMADAGGCRDPLSSMRKQSTESMSELKFHITLADEPARVEVAAREQLPWRGELASE